MPRTRDFTVSVETDCRRSFIIGRNGLFQLRAVEVQSSGGFAFISGVGRSGKPIDGGIRLAAEDMDRLAHRWLRERVRR